MTSGPSSTLDEAWVAAEAALPGGWKLRLVTNGRGTYVADAVPPFMSYEEWHDLRREAYGDTPAEALRALVLAEPVQP